MRNTMTAAAMIMAAAAVCSANDRTGGLAFGVDRPYFAMVYDRAMDEGDCRGFRVVVNGEQIADYEVLLSGTGGGSFQGTGHGAIYFFVIRKNGSPVEGGSGQHRAPKVAEQICKALNRIRR